jgi:hypothetical protein
MVYSNFRKFALVSVSLLGLAGFAGTASANTWQDNHPRRVEVNHRLNRQTDRIAHAVTAGQISPLRAVRLLRKEHQLRREERVMASLDHGHITRAEQRALNQQENRLSRRIP